MPSKINILFYMKNNQNNNLKYRKQENIKYLIKIINLGAKNGPVRWNELILNVIFSQRHTLGPSPGKIQMSSFLEAQFCRALWPMFLHGHRNS